MEEDGSSNSANQRRHGSPGGVQGMRCQGGTPDNRGFHTGRNIWEEEGAAAERKIPAVPLIY